MFEVLLSEESCSDWSLNLLDGDGDIGLMRKSFSENDVFFESNEVFELFMVFSETPDSAL